MMRDFFADIKEDIKKTVRLYQQEIDQDFQDDIHLSEGIETVPEIQQIQSLDEEEIKLGNAKRFIAYNREKASKAGNVLHDLLHNTFDAFLFVLIKNKTAFEDRSNLKRFDLDTFDLSQLQAGLHPATISSIGYKGLSQYLLLGLQKSLARLAMGESVAFQRRNADRDNMIDEDTIESGKMESWKSELYKREKHDRQRFEYEVTGMRVKSMWGEQDIINKILVILSETFNVDNDDIFFLGINVKTEEILSYANFNDFVMMPILTHYMNQFSHSNAASLMQILEANRLREA